MSVAPVPLTIGTGVSQAKLTPNETQFFEHNVSARGGWAYLNHFWAAGTGQVDSAIFRFYIDGESEASVVFQPSLACGVGFDDQAAPWGTKWVGKGAKSTGWFHNIPIIFYKHVRVTYQLAPKDVPNGQGTLWTIVRGAEGLPLQLGNLALPLEGGSVKLLLQVKTDVHLKPLEFYDLANVPRGKKGSIFMTSLFVNSTKNYNCRLTRARTQRLLQCTIWLTTPSRPGGRHGGLLSPLSGR